MPLLDAILQIKYLNNDHIKGFDNYKYSSVDTSPVAVYVSHPFWNQVVKIYPRWIAPNMLTFSGMILVMLGYWISAYLDYDLFASSLDSPAHPPIPNHWWLIFSVFTFLAHVLDGTDGKQARRTGNCGPTGELFDHGIDSWLTLPFTLTFFSVFGRMDYSISAFRMLLILMSVQLVFVITHWEKYNTGILFLSWGYDLSQYSLAFFYLITYIRGYEMWKFYIIGSVSPGNVAEFAFYYAAFGMSIPMSLYNIYQAKQKGTLLRTTVSEAMRPMVGTIILFGTAIIWAKLSPTNIIDRDPRSFMWAMGTIFSNIACRLIVAQMTGTRCDAWNWLLCPWIFFGSLSIFSILGSGGELIALRLVAVSVTLAHIHYGMSVVNQMCEHFGIRPFVIKDNLAPSPAANGSSPAKTTSNKIE